MPHTGRVVTTSGSVASRRRRGYCARFLHTVANNVFDEDWNEGLDWCMDEVLSGLLTPALDLGGAVLGTERLVTGQPVSDVGHGPRNR